MIRPEAKAQIIRWREALIGVIAVCIGLLWLSDAGPLFLLPALAALIGGAALIWIGVQRARFRHAGDGPGSVRVDEGQIIYFGPLTGGAVALRELTSVTLDHRHFPAHWRLREGTAPELLIPVNAEGAEALFDAFATLPGLRMEQVLAALKSSRKTTMLLWQRDRPVDVKARLH
ncbi:hypothetical protein CEP88_09620 [Roseobacter denitrificans]|uniref:Uncharacterized protein n=1 Tax=Roseobacter denitrificans (strain ATCC 33942 / OCh 114) TaxID=375451 RepID=Q160S1_ROSDO|nr:hypothetical protein [Roseobacter denitrificans]ABG33522.1 hypothetical protein RD1_4078 [Roseobacter denitrificans OCh 114]AVL54866.1 hypothetical protein CEP88_09620 [Roseobacter denitrificans]SFG04821.1 hypothetical protein SAMN05443635_106149 [Roseobacter denitrificans OCh 114]